MNKEKYFLLNRGLLEERLDPEYYLPKHYQLLNAINNSTSKVVPLMAIAKRIFDGPFGSSVKAEDYVDNGIPFIRVADVTNGDGTIKNKGLIFISREKHQEIKRSTVWPGDVIIAKTGATMGAASILPKEIEEANIRGDLAGVRIENDNELAQFITNYINTSIGYRLFWRLNSGATRGRVVISNLRKLPIVVPNPAKIKTINRLFAEARKTKNDLNIIVQNTFANIDKFLLDELQVNLPRQSKNTIDNRIFKTNWQKVTGNRFDPKKYSHQSESLFACIENSKLRKVPLKSLVVHSVAGDWGLDEKEDVNPKLFTKCLVIRATEFDNNYNLNIENSRAKFRLISNIKLKKFDIKPQDFLLEKSGGSPDQPVGRISILENELLEKNTIAYSNFIHKFRVNTNEVLPEFLFCFLKTIHNIKLTDVMQSQTNGIRNLIMREYWNQSIILPEKTKQKEIADTVYKMRAEAKQTEIDAQRGFERVKQEIEKLILE